MENQVKEYSKVEAALAEYTEDYKGVIYNCKVPAEMKVAKAAKQLFVKARTGLERLRVKAKKEALAHCKSVDSEANRITASLKELEEPIGAQIKIEVDRKAKIKADKLLKEQKARKKWLDIIEAIKRRPLDFIAASPEQITTAIGNAQSKSTDDFPEDLAEEAFEALQGAIEKLKEMHIAAVDRVELEKRVILSEPGTVSPAEAEAEVTEWHEQASESEGKPEQDDGSVIPCTVGKEGEIMPLETASGMPDVVPSGAGLTKKTERPEPSPIADQWDDLLEAAKPACDLLEQSPFTRTQEATINLRAAITAATEVQ